MDFKVKGSLTVKKKTIKKKKTSTKKCFCQFDGLYSSLTLGTDKPWISRAILLYWFLKLPTVERGKRRLLLISLVSEDKCCVSSSLHLWCQAGQKMIKSPRGALGFLFWLFAWHIEFSSFSEGKTGLWRHHVQVRQDFYKQLLPICADTSDFGFSKSVMLAVFGPSILVDFVSSGHTAAPKNGWTFMIDEILHLFYVKIS